jgi:hypothetical protein
MFHETNPCSLRTCIAGPNIASVFRGDSGCFLCSERGAGSRSWGFQHSLQPSVSGSLVIGGGWLIAVLTVFIMRGLFFGLFFIVRHRQQPMCIAIEEQGVGFGESQPDWWVFTDGIIGVRRMFGVWTITHHNGTLIHIPAI